MLEERKQELLNDIQDKFNVTLPWDDPSLVSFYIQCIVLDNLSRVIQRQETMRSNDLEKFNQFVANFHENCESVLNDVVETSLELSLAKVTADTAETRQKADEHILNGLNKMLEQVRAVFDEETKKLNARLSIYRQESKHAGIRSAILLLLGTVMGSLISILMFFVIFSFH